MGVVVAAVREVEAPCWLVIDMDITCFVDVEIQRYSRSDSAREVCSYSVLRQLRERKGRRTLRAPQNHN